MKKILYQNDSVLFVTVALLIFTINTLHAQVHSSTSAHTTYRGLSMTGYQGWFGTPGDGGTNNWRHYGISGTFEPGTASIEYWPDMREADEEEKYITEFVFDDGSPAYVFSSVHPKTVSRHFRWMEEYGIDGAFMQRFRSDFGIRTTMNKILGNALASAREHGRAIALMYDIGANIHVDGVPDDDKRTEEVNIIFNDWKELIDNLGLTTGGNDQPYLYHNGKPLIVLWGVGFPHRHTDTGLDVQYWVELVDSLQHSPGYGSCSVMLGVPTKWREGGGDCISGDEHSKMLELIKSVDIIQPWHTSRFSRSQMSSTYKSLVEADLQWCDANGIDYAPTISPGIREKILHGNDYEKEREGGYYFWDMARAAIEAGVKMLYLGMFDEVDEGTQYNKINNNPPYYSDDLSFASYGTDPEDHYLWLAGEATRALRGEFVMTGQMRIRADASGFLSDVEFSNNGGMFEMNLTSPAAGRKIYYADPYKVPDGAPTIQTERDAALFHNELAPVTAAFGAEDYGLYIRMIEVDDATDKVMAFKAVEITPDYGTPPVIEVENSLTFDGTDDFVDCGRAESLLISGTQITLEAWFKINEVKAETWQSTILAMDHGESGNDVGYFLRANNGQLNWGFGDGNWHEVKSTDGVQLFEPGTWNHVAGVYNGTVQKIYLNGNLIKSANITASVSPVPVEHLYIGASPNFQDRNISAELAEIRIWNDARSDSEIMEYAGKRINGSEEGLSAYWPVDEGTGQVIYDRSGSGNDGILGGVMDVNDFDPLWKDYTAVGVEDVSGSLPVEFELNQNYPNPFNPATIIKYSIPVNSRQYLVSSKNNTEGRRQNSDKSFQDQASNIEHRESSIRNQVFVSLKIYDILGRESATLVNKRQSPGQYSVTWDASGFPAGVYFYSISTEGFTETKKMLLLK